MKASFRHIFAALAAIAALTACTREIIPGRQGTDPQDGVRTIAVSFAAPTKTSWTPTETGIQPEFNKGDVIKVSNGSACEEKAIELDPQGNPYFTTTLIGDLKAVYPASAAKLNGNAIEGVKVSAIQTGKFADANICMANIAADATEATFHNETAILRFYVDQSIDVKMITVMCQNGFIATETIDIEEEMNQKVIIVLSGGMESLEDLSGSPEDLKPLSATTDDPGKRLCYVAILPVSNDNIGFFSMASTQDATGGLSQIINYNVSLGKGNIANAFIPYYIKVRVGGTGDAPEYQRWSYCNLGAFLPEEVGYYYSWGNTDGHWRNGVSDGYPFNSDVYNGTDEMASSQGASLTGDIGPSSLFDAAYIAWVAGQEEEENLKWRMPTKDEFETLLSTKPSVTAEGLVVSNTGLKFPFAGAVVDGEMISVFGETKAFGYWSSTKNSESPSYSYSLIYPDDFGNVVVQATERLIGLPIRPIYGDSAEEEEDVPEQEEKLIAQIGPENLLHWQDYAVSAEETTEEGVDCLKITTETTMEHPWDNQFACDIGQTLEKGKTYKVKVKIKTSEPFSIPCEIQYPDEDVWPSFPTSPNLETSTKWQELTCTGVCNIDYASRINFSIGDFVGDFYVAEVSLYELADSSDAL